MSQFEIAARLAAPLYVPRKVWGWTMAEMTTRERQRAAAQADIERWRKDLAAAEKADDQALAAQIRGWIVRRQTLLAEAGH